MGRKSVEKGEKSGHVEATWSGVYGRRHLGKWRRFPAAAIFFFFFAFLPFQHLFLITWCANLAATTQLRPVYVFLAHTFLFSTKWSGWMKYRVRGMVMSAAAQTRTTGAKLPCPGELQHALMGVGYHLHEKRRNTCILEFFALQNGIKHI